MKPSTSWTELSTKLGSMILAARTGPEPALRGVWFAGQRHFDGPGADWRHDDHDPLLQRAAAQIEAWLAGRITAFDLPLAPQGTAFQQAVWQALARIPYGATRTYGELAAGLGRPQAARAVGAATGRNPLSLIVPCHRLVGRQGQLTGYAGGLDRKRALLALESGTPGEAQP